MRVDRRKDALFPRNAAGLACAVGLLGLAPASASAQGWQGYGRDSQHSSLASNASQPPQRVRWSAPVDLAPQYAGGGSLLTHYGSPVITRTNTVIVPVKTAAGGPFRLDARRGSDGAMIWQYLSDYALPPHNWIPPYGPTLTPKDQKISFPGAGGTVISRTFPDSAAGQLSRTAFYGSALYNGNPGAFNASIQISTAITSDKLGNLYFGFVSDGSPLPGYSSGIPSGLARISSQGIGAFVSAAALSGDPAMKKVVYNCAPALSADGATVYVAVNNVDPASAGNFGNGYLCAANSTTLAPTSAVRLRDPRNAALASVSDDGTASPMVGTDGDVYFGVLEDIFPSNHARGWLLHFNATLSTPKTPAAFGWDLTPSTVPASSVPSYAGPSSYLLLIKYNNYAGFAGGNGLNKVAIVDPGVTQTDPVSGATVMKEVITVLGPSPDPGNGGVREWCINTAAVDPVGRCAVINSEDGRVYRWDFTTNTLSAGLTLAPPTGEAYTPTLIGPDGAVYAINNAVLNCCVAAP